MCHHRPLPQPFHLPKKKKAVKRRVKIKIIKKEKVRRHRATSCDILNVTLSTRRNKTLGEFPLPGCNCVGERYNRRGRVFHSPIHTMETVDFFVVLCITHAAAKPQLTHVRNLLRGGTPFPHKHTHTPTRRGKWGWGRKGRTHRHERDAGWTDTVRLECQADRTGR